MTWRTKLAQASPRPRVRPNRVLRRTRCAALQAEIRKTVGDVTTRPDGDVLVAEVDKARVTWALLHAAGGSQQMVMVAGARFQISESLQSSSESNCG